MQQSEQAFLSAMRTHSGIIQKVAHAYCHVASDREDLIQEITIQLWRSWRNYDSRRKLSTWIYRVAMNVAISFFRKTSRQRSFGSAGESFIHFAAEDNSAQSENIKRLYELIGELDELNRAVILLYLERFSHEEIAETLGITKTNVATKIARIKQKLKLRFEQNEKCYEL